MRKCTCGSMPPGRTMRPVASSVSSPSSGSLAIDARRPLRMPRLATTGPAGRTSVPPLIATSNAGGMLASFGAHRLERIGAAEDLPEVDSASPIIVKAKHGPPQTLGESEGHQLEWQRRDEWRQQLVIWQLDRQHGVGQVRRFGVIRGADRDPLTVHVANCLELFPGAVHACPGGCEDECAGARSGAEILLMGPLLELLANRRVRRGFDEFRHAEQRRSVVRTTAYDAYQTVGRQGRGNFRRWLSVGLDGRRNIISARRDRLQNACRLGIVESST